MAPADRIEALDAIRGVALLGVALANVLFAFRVSPTAAYLSGDHFSPGIDGIAEAFVRYAVQGKALALFSILFGVGLAIQRERFAASGHPGRLARRLLVLLAFGLAHRFLLWNGDILVDYALGGMVLLAFMDSTRRTLLRVAMAILAFYVVAPFLPFLPDWPDDATLLRELARAMEVYPDGTFAAIREYSAHEWLVFLPVWIALFPSTPLLMVVGILAWRSSALADPAAHRDRLAAVGLAGLVVGGILTAMQSRDPMGTAGYVAFLAAATFAPPLVALGYGALLRLAFETPAGRRVLHLFAPAGRMAFTNYIVQSLAFGWVFFGYGLGLMGQAGAAATLAFGLAFFAMQAAASRWWLARFRFGPLEWLWRTLTYGRAQPMAR